ncbi:hypothetical protein [Paenibacillus periandrae]|uniref:hypothetical protein n=1 Tax=Paenibacillus periandrae TaxID=1761741 RepID=UPI001F09E24E|nr:hypothetical protein [Paenibacillus periandrae]
MNLFNHYKQRENHCTNILMNLLSMRESDLLQPFLNELLHNVSVLDYNDVRFLLFAQHPPERKMPHEFLVGVAPFPRKETIDKIIPNPGSIPDAWIIGKNFTILFEFKVTGMLDEAQLASHKEKLSPNCQIIEFTWKQVGEVLRRLNHKDGTTQWLIEQFCEVISEFESPRPASGMPKEIIRFNGPKTTEPYFIITGNKRLKTYNVDVKLPMGEPQRLLNDGVGIEANRRWIRQYIQSSGNPIAFLGEDSLVIDYTIDPDRDPKKNKFQRWIL